MLTSTTNHMEVVLQHQGQVTSPPYPLLPSRSAHRHCLQRPLGLQDHQGRQDPPPVSPFLQGTNLQWPPWTARFRMLTLQAPQTQLRISHTSGSSHSSTCRPPSSHPPHCKQVLRIQHQMSHNSSSSDRIRDSHRAVRRRVRRLPGSGRYRGTFSSSISISISISSSRQ